MGGRGGGRGRGVCGRGSEAEVKRATQGWESGGDISR